MRENKMADPNHTPHWYTRYNQVHRKRLEFMQLARQLQSLIRVPACGSGNDWPMDCLRTKAALDQNRQSPLVWNQKACTCPQCQATSFSSYMPGILHLASHSKQHHHNQGGACKQSQFIYTELGTGYRKNQYNEVSVLHLDKQLQINSKPNQHNHILAYNNRIPPMLSNKHSPRVYSNTDNIQLMMPESKPSISIPSRERLQPMKQLRIGGKFNSFSKVPNIVNYNSIAKQKFWL